MEAANDLGLIVGHGAMPENYLGVAESTVMLIAALCLDLHGKETPYCEPMPHGRRSFAPAWRGVRPLA
jgi:D-3-phosphoglycerate dehydrogenase